MDNIGGIVSAEYILADDVKSCALVADKIKIGMATGKSWVDFNPTPGRIEVTVTPGDENGLTPYTVSGIIYCPRFSMERYGELRKFNFRKILLKYVTGNGDVLVAGDTENPLKVQHENLNPSAANGYSGTKITISGVMKHPELVLME
jgi:hypothetical protein